jgi:hypothetical protein
MKFTSRPARHVKDLRTASRRGASHRAAASRIPNRRKHFSEILRHLRETLPPAFPVVVETGRELATAQGTCSRVGQQFRIRICKSLDDEMATEVLMHEWAHALAWNHAHDRATKDRSISDLEFERVAHGPEWGCAYSQVYIAFVTHIAPHLIVDALNAPIRQQIAAATSNRSRTSRRGRKDR